MASFLEVSHVPSTELSPKNSTKRTAIHFQEPKEENIEPVLKNFSVPIFKLDSYYALVKDLALLWNYPSSYQLIAKIIKRTGSSLKEHFQQTDEELNEALFKNNLIKSTEVRSKLFFINLKYLYSLIENKSIFFEVQNTTVEPISKELSYNEDKITISQVFPQYGLVDSNVELTHSYFNSLNKLTKLQYYKTLPNAYKFLPNSKLSFTERELIFKENDFSEIKISEQKNVAQERKNKRKPIGKSKKNNMNIDPNTLDLRDSIIPGQGYIQEFNVNHICKVPNYYIIGNQQGTPSLVNLKKNASNSSLLFNDNVKMSKNIQQLVYNNDNDNYSHSKYFYTKSYRGPGSGNYKDAALMNKINKLPLTSRKASVNHKVTKDVIKLRRKRYNQNIKGLAYEKFDKDAVESLFSKQGDQTDDFANLEILHNNLQFNLLINTYREISEETWKNYYKFKLIDFEQLGSIKNPKGFDLMHKFTLPSEHKEILHNLPSDLRGDTSKNDEEIPPIKKPILYSSATEDPNNPELMNKIDIIKFPNSNSIGWDNLRRYKQN